MSNNKVRVAIVGVGNCASSLVQGRTLGDVPLNAELKLEVWDSPNSAGVVIDAVRLVKLGLDRGLGGTLEGPSAYLMKSPPVQYADDEAHELTEAFIQEIPAPTSKASKPLEQANGHKVEAAPEQ